MSDEEEFVEEEPTVPVWGYSDDYGAQIFDLKPGGKLPKGWVDSPAKLKSGKPQTRMGKAGDGNGS